MKELLDVIKEVSPQGLTRTEMEAVEALHEAVFHSEKLMKALTAVRGDKPEQVMRLYLRQFENHLHFLINHHA